MITFKESPKVDVYIHANHSNLCELLCAISNAYEKYGVCASFWIIMDTETEREIAKELHNPECGKLFSICNIGVTVIEGK